MNQFFVFIAMSLDGYIAGPNGELDWLSVVNKEGEDYGYSQFFQSIDTILMGKNTYETVIGFPEWHFFEKRVIVFTNQPFQSKYNEVFFKGTVDEFIHSNQSVGLGNVYVDGGYLIHSFLQARKIDQLTVSIIPILLGKGIPLFKGSLEKTNLQLMTTKSFSTGLVQVTYKL